MKLLRLPEVMERTSLRRSTIYEMMQAGTFPKPVKLNLRANGCVESEIDAFIAERMAEREALIAAGATHVEAEAGRKRRGR